LGLTAGFDFGTRLILAIPELLSSVATASNAVTTDTPRRPEGAGGAGEEQEHKNSDLSKCDPSNLQPLGILKVSIVNCVLQCRCLQRAHTCCPAAEVQRKLSNLMADFAPTGSSLDRDWRLRLSLKCAGQADRDQLGRRVLSVALSMILIN
jgi:hypothetical protein